MIAEDTIEAGRDIARRSRAVRRDVRQRHGQSPALLRNVDGEAMPKKLALLSVAPSVHCCRDRRALV